MAAWWLATEYFFLFSDDGEENVETTEEKVEENLSDPGLVEEEEKDVGVVKYDVYRSYWQAAGVCLTFSIFLSLFLMQGKHWVVQLSVSICSQLKVCFVAVIFTGMIIILPQSRIKSLVLVWLYQAQYWYICLSFQPLVTSVTGGWPTGFLTTSIHNPPTVRLHLVT